MLALLDQLWRPALVIGLAALALVAFMYLTQRGMLYFPSSVAPDPSLLPPGGEEIAIQTDDGLRLGAWFVPAAGADDAAPAVLVFNGNAGNRAMRLPLALALADRGYAVLLFDYRGYAGNRGSPTEDGLRTDARAAAAALAARPEVDPSRIGYFGESLGAAVAGGLATERPPSALVLRSPFSSVADAARHHYPFLPVVDALVLDRYALADQVRELDGVPLLVLVTENDEIVPASLSRRVHDAAAEPKRLVALDAAHHNDPALLAGEQLLAEVDGFLREAMAAERP